MGEQTSEKERETERETGRERERQKEREIGRERERDRERGGEGGVKGYYGILTFLRTTLNVCLIHTCTFIIIMVTGPVTVSRF